MVGTYNTFPGILTNDKDPIRIVDDPQRFADEVV